MVFSARGCDHEDGHSGFRVLKTRCLESWFRRVAQPQSLTLCSDFVVCQLESSCKCWSGSLSKELGWIPASPLSLTRNWNVEVSVHCISCFQFAPFCRTDALAAQLKPMMSFCKQCCRCSFQPCQRKLNENQTPSGHLRGDRASKAQEYGWARLSAAEHDTWRPLRG